MAATKNNNSMYVELDDLAILFGYRNAKTASNAIRNGCFPVHCFKVRGRWVAEREGVKTFFREQRDKARAKLDKRP